MSKTFYIAHASEGYNADYAHWYYENYVKKGLTKGREKSPNQMSKEESTKQRDSELAEVRAQKKDATSQLANARSLEIKQEREKLKRDLKSYRAATKDQIQRMWFQLKTMSIDEREKQEGAFREQLEALKKTNEKQRELLQSTYEKNVEGIREGYKQAGSEINNYYNSLSKQIIDKYNNMRISDVGSAGSSAGSYNSSSNSEKTSTEPTKEKPKKLGSVSSPKRERENKTYGAGRRMYKLGQ